MNKLHTLLLAPLSLLLLPVVASAQLVGGNDLGDFGVLLENIIEFINTILIPFILALAFLAFVWGVFQYFIAGGANDEKKEKGKSLMIYAIAGFVLILAFWGIVNLLASSTGLDDADGSEVEDLLPQAPTGGGGGGGGGAII